MSRFNFKGNLEFVAPQQLELISKVLEERGFKGPDVNIEAVGAAGDNYIANVKRIVINENGTTFKMIAKLAPENPIMRASANIDMLFNNEYVMYSKVLPKFRELQRSADVPKEEWFRFAECYGSNAEAPHEVILLEDLNVDNFIMLDRFKPLTTECVKVVMKNLAIFHSLSYVLKHREPETFAAFKSKLIDIYKGPMSTHKDVKMFLQQIEQSAIATLQEDKYKKCVNGSVSNMFHNAIKLGKTDTDSRRSIIQQGDGWTNNILFKMENDTPVNCVLIDYQASRESNPVYDIMYMLFNSTNHEQRHKHFYEFIDHYHSELDKSLNNYGLKASFMFPRDQLDTDLKRYAKLLLGSTIMNSSFTTRKSENANQFKETMLGNNEDKEEAMKAALVQDQDTTLLFKSKIEGLVDSFLEFGLLQNI